MSCQLQVIFSTPTCSSFFGEGDYLKLFWNTSLNNIHCRLWCIVLLNSALSHSSYSLLHGYIILPTCSSFFGEGDLGMGRSPRSSIAWTAARVSLHKFSFVLLNSALSHSSYSLLHGYIILYYSLWCSRKFCAGLINASS